MTGKENREIKNSVFVDLFYEDESAEANDAFNAIRDTLPEGTKIRDSADNTIYMNFSKRYFFWTVRKSDRIRRASLTVNENMPSSESAVHRTCWRKACNCLEAVR